MICITEVYDTNNGLGIYGMMHLKESMHVIS